MLWLLSRFKTFLRKIKKNDIHIFHVTFSPLQFLTIHPGYVYSRFIVVDKQLCERLCPSVQLSVVIESKKSKNAHFDAAVLIVCVLE